MGKRKDQFNSSGIGKEENLIWNYVMDSILIDAFVHQNEIGNRVGGTFTSKAYKCIVRELSEKFPEKRFDKERIKNRIKYIKKGFGPCYDIFKNGLSGFSWDPMKSMWCAESEVWDKSTNDEIVILKESLMAVVDAILKSTNDLVKSQPTPLMPTNEIWNMLEELGIDGPERKKTYIFLATNPKMLDVFLGCPVSERKELLEFMSFD